MSELKALVEQINTAFAEFREANDERLKALENKKTVDPLLAEKVDRINDILAAIEDKMAKAQADMAGRVDELEAGIKQNGLGLSTPDGNDDPEITSAFNRYLKDGFRALTGDERSKFERKALQAGADVSGGFLVTPQQFITSLLKNVDDMVAIRGLATINQLTTAASLGVPKLDTDLDDWGWTVELGTGSEDTAMRFGKREMFPNPIAKRVKISETLIRKAVLDVAGLVRDRMAYKLGGTMENAYMVGTGAKQPLGMFVASDDGVPTSRDVSTDNTTTQIKPDNLITVQGTLKEQYQGNARWLFHRDALTQIRKLKDGNGQYLWVPGLQAGAANQILNKPYVLSEWCPNTFTTGKYVGMYADFRYYWIVDTLNMAIKVLNELYAETNQIGYIGRYEGDGQPVLAEAFVRIKLG